MMTKQKKEDPPVSIKIPSELPLKAGARFALWLSRPLETMEIEVLFGDKPAEDLILHAPDRIYGRAPEGAEGTQDLLIRSGKKILLHEKDAFTRSRTPKTPTPKKPRAPEKPRRPIPIIEKDPFKTGPASNWWMLHQDLQHTSNARSSQFRKLQPLWKHSFTGFFDITQPIFAPGRVLIGCGFGGDETEAFVALDFESGEPLWTRWKVENGNRFVLGTPVAIAGRVYFVEESSDDQPALVTCLDIEDGEHIWSFPLPVSWTHSALASAFGMVYGISRSGHVGALDAESGAVHWHQPLEVGPGACVSSPAVMFGSVYAGSMTGLHVFDAINGELGWVADTPPNWTASPAVITAVQVGHPAIVVIGGNDQILRAFNAVSGEPMWEYAGDCWLSTTTPSSSEDRRLYLKQWQTVVALDVMTGTVIHTSPNFGVNVISAPTITENAVLVVVDGEKGHRLLLLDRHSLDVLAEEAVDWVHRGDHGAPSVLGDHIFVCDSRVIDGTIHASVKCFQGIA